jgi:hypothetical protein
MKFQRSANRIPEFRKTQWYDLKLFSINRKTFSILKPEKNKLET